MVNCSGSVTAGSGNSLHIKGASAAVFVSNCDLGPSPGPSTGATALIESGTNGSPKQIVIHGGILEGGSTGLAISAGTLITIVGVDLVNNGSFGVNITGGDAITLQDCGFDVNGSTGGTGHYDFQSSTENNVEVLGCYFHTPQGTGSQEVASAVNVTAGSVVMQACSFKGAGMTLSNIFTGYPSIIRGCPGYNPVGDVTAPTIGSSPYTAPTKSTDMTVFVSGGVVSSIAIGGTATGLTSGAFRVPAQQTITLTYVDAPSWTWFSD